MSAVHTYLHAVVRRGREPMEPVGFEPDWLDQPRGHKVYGGAARFPLAHLPAQGAASVDAGLHGTATGGAFTLATLAGMLGDSYGLHARRLAVTANTDLANLSWYSNATWARGTASGGGLYPLEIYLVNGGEGPLLPGVHYYSPHHHEFVRLLAGDVSGSVRAALGDLQPAIDTEKFLLVSVRFWRNAFKYNSFSYHAVTMDVGALLGTWQTWARAHAITAVPILWFDEPALDRLLGVAPHEESVFAVLPLPWEAAHGRVPTATASGEGDLLPRVRSRPAERSRRVVRFPQVEAVQQEAMEGVRPSTRQLRAAAPLAPSVDGERLTPLPAPAALPMPLRGALKARRSSFGRFSQQPAVSIRELSAVLAAGTAGGRLVTDAKQPDGLPLLTRLVAFVNHVDDLAPGIYDHDAECATLGLRSEGTPALFLQRTYFLTNYNLEQAGVVLAVLARPFAAIDAAGARGYRLVNAEVGAVAQAIYTSCAALGLGCGAALGFDNESYVERLGLAGGPDWPLLLLMVGRERLPSADLDHRIA